MLGPRDLQVLNTEISTQVQEMEHAIANGKKYNSDTLEYLTDLKSALQKIRAMMRPPEARRSQLSLVA